MFLQVDFFVVRPLEQFSKDNSKLVEADRKE